MTFDPLPWAQAFALACVGVGILLFVSHFARYLATQTALINAALASEEQDDEQPTPTEGS